MHQVRRNALVLLVEDDEERVAWFRRWLAGPKLRLLHAKTGDAALRCVDVDRYDLILLDHDLEKQHPKGRLAEVNGTTIVHRLIAGRTNRQTRIIIHSMNPGAREEMLRRLQANGFDAAVEAFADWTPEWARGLAAEVVAEWEADAT